jgi:hypothetical protein
MTNNYANYTDSFIGNRRLNLPINYLDAVFGTESRQQDHAAALQQLMFNKELKDN